MPEPGLEIKQREIKGWGLKSLILKVENIFALDAKLKDKNCTFFKGKKKRKFKYLKRDFNPSVRGSALV